MAYRKYDKFSPTSVSYHKNKDNFVTKAPKKASKKQLELLKSLGLDCSPDMRKATAHNILKDYYHKDLATDKQKQLLNSLNVSYKHNISKKEAMQLIKIKLKVNNCK